MTMILLIVLIFSIPIATYAITSIWLRVKLRSASGLPPSVPYVLPLIAHTPTFASGSDTLANALRRNAVPGAALRFKGIGFNFVLLSGADFIRKALSTHHFDWNKISAPLFVGMFGGPQKIKDALAKDDSGIGVKPYPGSDVHPGRRLMRNQIVFFADAFSKTSMDALVPIFILQMEDWCSKSNVISEDWVEMPSLYLFVRDVLFSSSVEALFGPNLLGLNPELAKDFWEYDDSVGFLALGMPNWLKPNAAKARSRVLEALKRWRRNAVNNADPAIAEDAAWNPAWGLGAIRRRNKLLDATEGLFDEDGRASIDLALLWSMTSNVIPASFWYLVEVLGSQQLQNRVLSEVDREIGPAIAGHLPKFDPATLTNNPLLQAVYAETLRLHIATLITRVVKKEHTVGSWLLAKGQDVMVASNVEHMHPQWDSTGADGDHPATDFWPDRFLTSPNGSSDKATFSLDGRQGQWIPFGLGEHLCPGRHFAKQEMIINAVVMLATFEMELTTPEGWRPANDFGRYGFGTQHPKEKVSFRIRRRRYD
ncbi:cytochrome P450 [Clathrospora elynae]|uniref:Cytochrome P450 n=1 Tax=Clathrospora elynae TaxID=706981 RepID=A0A6A5SMH9_9PLEO|nr:cytochrome P450 [Clathrospora elynae]